MTQILKLAKWLGTVIVTVLLTVYFVMAFTARHHTDLGPEHRVSFEHEFDALQEADTDWSAYVAIEQRLVTELDAAIASTSRPPSLVDRYAADSLTRPDNFDGNWNLSYEIRAPAALGVAVLVHGLTDSPYALLATAEAMLAEGYSVVVPRMPGHGFAVGGMLQARSEDWSAAVRVAVRHAQQLPGAEQSLILGGYSNGGLMALHYALTCGHHDGLQCPDGLLLISPAIGVSPLAALSNVHSAISWLPYFEKFKWQTVLPEVDPFKFTSFPSRAAWEIQRLLKLTHAQLDDADAVAKLPPILTFQSIADDTVSAEAVLTRLYLRLPANGSRLVVYDVNRNSTLLQLMNEDDGEPASLFQSLAPLEFDVSVLQNHDNSGMAVDHWSLAAGESQAQVAATNLRWPDDVFSLSHIALPFRADDLIYGNGMRPESRSRIVLGAVAPRGERRIMRLNADYFLRMRHNPFFGFQQAKLIEWLGAIRRTD